MKDRVLRYVVAVLLVAGASSLDAQRGGGAPQGAQSAQAGAPIDLSGYWVSIVNEDWRWRMVTPPKGDYASVPISAEGRKVADSWDVSKDGSCLAFGAAGVMRMPTRLHITWESDSVLKIETDAGQQTRRFMFDKSLTPPTQRSLQGFSVAEWERPNVGRGGPGGPGGPPPGAAPPGAPAGAPPAAAPAAAPAGGRAGGPAAVGARAGGPPNRGGDLKVITTQLSGGWLRRNGVPYSESATVTEFYDRFGLPSGDEWLVVTTVVADPKYLAQDFVTSTHFRREPTAAKWDPTPCKPST